MAIGWKDGVNIVIEGLVTRLATLEGKVKELEEDKAAKTKKINDLEKELRTASNNSNTKCTTIIATTHATNLQEP